MIIPEVGEDGQAKLLKSKVLLMGAGGLGCEPASAVTLAGLKKLVKRGFVKRGETVVLVLTGHLLKDPDFTIKFHRGELFAGTPHEAESSQAKHLQRAPLQLDADLCAVIGVLEAADRNS